MERLLGRVDVPGCSRGLPSLTKYACHGDAENSGAAGFAEVDGARAFGETSLDRRCSGQVIGAADPQEQVDESLQVFVIDVNAAQHD